MTNNGTTTQQKYNKNRINVIDLHIMLGQVPLCMDDTDAFNTMVEDIKGRKTFEDVAGSHQCIGGKGGCKR
jgi:hypothetical protein